MHHGTMIEELISAVSRAEAHASLPRAAAGAESRPNIEETLFARPLPQSLPAPAPQRTVLFLQPTGAA